MGASTLLASDKAIVFFDDECLLCSRFVNILLKNDKYGLQKDKFALQKGKFILHYAGLNSHIASEVLSPKLISQPETVVFAEDGILYYKSAAVFRILSYLRMPWTLLKVFKVLPTSMNNRLYDWVAKNRKRWFGRSEECYLPAGNYKSRFLD